MDATQAIEEELAALSDTELLGGWKCLIASMVFHAIRRYLINLTPSRNEREQIAQAEAAAAWLEDKTGVVSFSEACDVLGFEPDALIERLNLLRERGNFTNIPSLTRR